MIPNLLEKTDPRYVKWRKSLKKRPPPWCKGLTKETDSRVQKISKTMRRKKIDNFASWREKMIKLGKIRNSYPSFKKSKELAFLVGLTLGDGNISNFPRTECLTIALNTKYPKLIEYTYLIMKRFFQKNPSRNLQGNCSRLRVYQKQISRRLSIPTGSRKNLPIAIPRWIWINRTYLIWYLKGLFEAEGSLSIHLPTCTYNFQFSNRNPKLLANVSRGLKKLGYHPEHHPVGTRLRKRNEVKSFEKLISFRRDYPAE